MRYQQCRLKSGTTRLICLLPEGSVNVDAVTLKDDVDPERRWEVRLVGRPISQEFVHRTWDNNI